MCMLISKAINLVSINIHQDHIWEDMRSKSSDGALTAVPPTGGLRTAGMQTGVIRDISACTLVRMSAVSNPELLRVNSNKREAHMREGQMRERGLRRTEGRASSVSSVLLSRLRLFSFFLSINNSNKLF